MRKVAITITVILGLITLWIAKAFLIPILFGAIVATLLVGPHERLKKKIKPEWSALLLTLASLVVVFLPITLLTVSGVRTAITKVQRFRETAQVDTSSKEALTDSIIQLPAVDRFLTKLGGFVGMDTEGLMTSAEGFVQKGGLWVANFLGGLFTAIPEITVELFLVLLAIYFVLVDGDKLSRFIRENSVFPPSETEEIMSAYHELCRSTLLATLVSGLAQAATFLIGLLIVGASGIPLITLLVFFTSFVPLFGAGPVTAGYTLIVFLSGNTSHGIILAVFTILTGLSDNIVRPFVLKGSANIHPLIALVALFGGLEVFGFSGVFLGPLAVGLFMVTLDCLLRTTPKNMGAY